MEQPAPLPVPHSDPPIVLDARWEAAEDGPDAAGAVIAPPHPLMGGSMDVPVVTEVAHACRRAGLSALRFDWRGVGASGGTPSGDPAPAAADYGAALDFLEESVDGPLTACGYSFGAATAVRACAGRVRVRRMLLVAPPPAMITAAEIAAFVGRLLVVVGDRDEYAPLDDVKAMLSDHANAELAVLPDVDHFFMNGLSELGRRAGEWL